MPWTREQARAMAIKSREVRSAQQLAQVGREGGRATAMAFRLDLLAKYAELSREDAIIAARRDGQRESREQRRRVVRMKRGAA